MPRPSPPTDEPEHQSQPAERDEHSMRVAILGAGTAGLSAALHLASRQVSVEVLERNDYVGGLCVTHEHKGFRFDLGGHRWFTKNRALHEWFLRLMDGELVTVQRTSRIYFDGKYYDYPLSLKNVLANAGVLTCTHAVMSYLAVVARNLATKKKPQNLAEAFTAQFGAKLFEMFFRRYSEKVWGTPCEEISAAWADQRSKGLSILQAVKSAFHKSNRVTSLIEQFEYPRYGYQRICDRMTEDAVRQGSTVRLAAPVQRIAYRGPYDFSLTYRSPDGPRETTASHVMSTIPLTRMLDMLDPACDQRAVEAARSLRFRDLITVTVLLRKERMTKDTWVYVHDNDLVITRLHEPKNWSLDMVPDPSCTSVVCECLCFSSDAVWDMPDEEFSARVVSDLADRLGFIRHDEVIDTVVVRTTHAYPVYDLDYKSKLDTISAALERYEGLTIIGRSGAFRYNNADHSIEMGQLYAKRLLGEAADPMSVNAEPRVHR